MAKFISYINHHKQKNRKKKKNKFPTSNKQLPFGLHYNKSIIKSFNKIVTYDNKFIPFTNRETKKTLKKTPQKTARQTEKKLK